MCFKPLLFVAALLNSIFVFQAGAVATSGYIGEPTAADSSLQMGPVAEIELEDLLSPSMRWSYMSIDALKQSGLDIVASDASTAELLNKSEAIRVAAVAQMNTTPTPEMPNTSLLTALLIFVSGCMMWMGLTLKRPD